MLVTRIPTKLANAATVETTTVNRCKTSCILFWPPSSSSVGGISIITGLGRGVDRESPENSFKSQLIDRGAETLSGLEMNGRLYSSFAFSRA